MSEQFFNQNFEPQAFICWPMPVLAPTTEVWVYRDWDSGSKAFVKLPLEDYYWWFGRE